MKAVIFTHVLYLILMKTFTVKGIPKCESKVELRAVMLSCPGKDAGCDDDDPLTQAMKSEESQILQSKSNNLESLLEEKGGRFPDEVQECKRKLVISLKIKNQGKIPCDDEYIVVDHVFDPVTGGRGRLLSPVVVKLRQEQMVQLYGLQFERVINSDPFEEQKTDGNTCSVDPENPTCGIAMYDGKPIPFSEGFCCSSDPHVNAKRQLPPVSSADPFLYRHFKLISRGNSRLAREEKPRAIVNPELVKLKSRNPDDTAGNKKGSDCIALSDPLNWEKVPNYLLENDRKIVCDRGDFMRELCRLREDKLEAEGAKSGKGGSKMLDRMAEDIIFPNKEFVTNEVHKDLRNYKGEDNVAVLKRLIEQLNMDQTTSSSAMSDGKNSENVSRGKRENKEGKNINLDKKLKRFTKSKGQSINRRKRLLELSHKRFRKWEGDQGGPESQKLPEASCKAYPPRYFFSHDRAIIDPLETDSVVINSSCKSYLKEDEQEEDVKHERCRTPDKGEFFKKKKFAERSFYRRHWKNDNKLKTKENIGSKKEKMNRIESNRMANNPSKERESEAENLKAPLKETASKSGRRFKCKGTEKVKGGDEMVEFMRRSEVGGKKEEGEAKVMDRFGDSMGQVNTKRLKNFLHKSDLNKKQTKSKFKSNFSPRSRDQQKLVRGHKHSDLNHRELFASRKLKEPAITGYSRAQNDHLQGLRLEVGRENAKEDLKPFRLPETPKFHQMSKEKPDINEVLLRKDVLGKKNQFKDQTSYTKKPRGKKKFSDFDALGQRRGDANVNFDLEIIRSENPSVTSWRSINPSFTGGFMKNGLGTGVDLNDNIYNFRGNMQHAKSPQNFLSLRVPSQDYYVLDNEKVFPQEWFQTSNDRSHFVEGENSPRLQLVSENLMNNAHRSPNRDASICKNQGFGESRPEFGEKEPTPEVPLVPSRTKAYKKSRKKRSASYSFQSARIFRGSEFGPRETEEGVVGGRESRGADSRSSELPLNFSLPGQENLSLDWSALSGLCELLNGVNYPANDLRAASSGEKSTRSISDKLRLIRSYANAPDYVLEEVESSLKGKRQAKGETKENSGEGSPCRNSGRDTAHCMRFGDMWYSMYGLKPPVVSQIAGIQLFDKHPGYDGTSQWRDLTKGKMIRVGTFLTKAEDELPTISVTFLGDKNKKVEGTIDTDNYYLLVPSHVSDPAKVNYYPQFEGGPAEYLLVHSKDISSGGECDMIGTSFEAFARQPDRCSRRRGSCLKRQPVDLWREDMEARIKGKRGKYFVENFGNVPNSPVKSYSSLTGEFLALEDYGEYMSTIEIEMKADSNAIIRKGSSAQIPMVYVDSTFPEKTRIILSVLNIGLTSSYFRPRLGGCPPKVNPAWCPLEGPLVTIPPQKRHDFKLDLSGTPPNGKTILTVEVLNQINKPIALRKIILKRSDRCVCAFHCKCNCVGSSANVRTCRRLSLDDYRKAGYIGSFPFRGGAAVSSQDSVLGNMHIILFTAAYLLLLIGMMKGILGIYFRRLGIAGVRIITGPKELSRYYECELLGCSVLYDEFGFPVHPTTCQPVQIVPLWLEIIINLLFFFLYPLKGICFFVSSSSCCKGICCANFCQNPEGDCDRKSSSPLLEQPNLTSIYYNLTTVDSKKSKQEYLPYPAYNGDDDPLEEDDTEFVLQEMKRYRKK